MIYRFESITTILLSVIGIVITLGAQFYVTSNYNKYKTIKNKKEISGFEAARKILDENNLQDIHIVETRGELSDHYDPTRKVIRLSKDIFNGTSIASVSVAAHEAGHALQDKEGYSFMRIRSILFPVVNIFSRIGYFAIVIGFLFGILDLAYVGIFLLLALLFFNIITLPVEFNASNRAKVQLGKLAILESSEATSSETMLRAAAMTYVASLVATLLQILRLFLMARRRDD